MGLTAGLLHHTIYLMTATATILYRSPERVFSAADRGEKVTIRRGKSEYVLTKKSGQGALEVVHDLVDEPVSGILRQQLIMGEHPLRIADGLDHPGAALDFAGPQVEDQVIELAGHRERPERGALLMDRSHVRGCAGVRAGDGDRRRARG